MHKNAQPFKLEPEDFLPERPAPLTPERLLELEVDPAPWALKASCKLGGKRHSKRVIQHTYVQDYRTAGSAVPMLPYAPYGAPRFDARDDYQSASYKRALGKRQRKQAEKGAKQVSVYSAVPPGNLKINDDYKFWKGIASPTSLWDDATCRWCGLRVLGRDEMLEHFGKPGHGYCRERLLALYAYAKQYFKSPFLCFVCKQDCGKHTYWGVPMCKKVQCIARWKFTGSYQLTGFNFYHSWADEAQFRNPASGPYAGLPDEDASGGPC